MAVDTMAGYSPSPDTSDVKGAVKIFRFFHSPSKPPAAPGQGFEPRYAAPKAAVLPLNDPGPTPLLYRAAGEAVKRGQAFGSSGVRVRTDRTDQSDRRTPERLNA